jgi:exopolysaccharide biosynthesis protein
LSEPHDRGPTLAELGDWLAAEGCSEALNLDGGPSTAAAFRDGDRVSKIGAGVGLPYAIRFAPR